MSKKIFIVLLVGFITQTMVSCICDCPAPIRERIIYSGLMIKGLDTTGYDISDIDQSIYKSNLGLEIDVTIDVESIGCLYPVKFTLFNSVFACSCDDPYYEILDGMVNMEVYMINSETNFVENVTMYFNVYNGGGEDISINTLFEEYEYYGSRDPYFRLSLISTEFIPSSANFTVDIHLESGKVLQASTGIINFID